MSKTMDEVTPGSRGEKLDLRSHDVAEDRAASRLSTALASPWIQILGRLRCLVQGCCHESPAPADVGILYRHRRNHVSHIAGFDETPTHPTPLYSIAGNLVIGALLIRLRTRGAADTLLVGVYLMLSGCARSVDESYRGEPQTPVVGGLRICQMVRGRDAPGLDWMHHAPEQACRTRIPHAFRRAAGVGGGVFRAVRGRHAPHAPGRHRRRRRGSASS